MAEDAVTRTRRLWDRYAPRHDKDMRRAERLFFADARQWVCSQAVGDTLEVGVGTGLNLPHYPLGTRLTGVDISPGMLAIARERAADLDLTIDLREADAQALPFDDMSFDTIVCTLSLCSVPDDRAAITEMHRVLRRGGRLLLLDHVAAPNRLLRAAQHLVEQITVRQAGDYQTRRPLPLIEQAGLVVEDSRRTKAGTIERLRAVRPAR